MTHQNHQTNGASLEDCHTNFFALVSHFYIDERTPSARTFLSKPYLPTKLFLDCCVIALYFWGQRIAISNSSELVHDVKSSYSESWYTKITLLLYGHRIDLFR